MTAATARGTPPTRTAKAAGAGVEAWSRVSSKVSVRASWRELAACDSDLPLSCAAMALALLTPGYCTTPPAAAAPVSTGSVHCSSGLSRVPPMTVGACVSTAKSALCARLPLPAASAAAAAGTVTVTVPWKSARGVISTV